MQQFWEIMTLIEKYWGALLLIGSIIGIERAPIKFSPISSCLKWLRKIIGTEEVSNQIKDINIRLDDIEQNQNKRIDTEKRLDEYDKRFDKIEEILNNQNLKDIQDTVERIRETVLDFDTKCRQGYIPTFEQFTFILNRIYDYEKLCEEYHIKNGKMKDAIRFLRQYFDKLSLDHGFCTENHEE